MRRSYIWYLCDGCLITTHEWDDGPLPCECGGTLWPKGVKS